MVTDVSTDDAFQPSLNPPSPFVSCAPTVGCDLEDFELLFIALSPTSETFIDVGRDVEDEVLDPELYYGAFDDIARLLAAMSSTTEESASSTGASAASSSDSGEDHWIAFPKIPSTRVLQSAKKAADDTALKPGRAPAPPAEGDKKRLASASSLEPGLVPTGKKKSQSTRQASVSSAEVPPPWDDAAAAAVSTTRSGVEYAAPTTSTSKPSAEKKRSSKRIRQKSSAAASTVTTTSSDVVAAPQQPIQATSGDAATTSSSSGGAQRKKKRAKRRQTTSAAVGPAATLDMSEALASALPADIQERIQQLAVEKQVAASHPSRQPTPKQQRVIEATPAAVSAPDDSAATSTAVSTAPAPTAPITVNVDLPGAVDVSTSAETLPAPPSPPIRPGCIPLSPKTRAAVIKFMRERSREQGATIKPSLSETHAANVKHMQEMTRQQAATGERSASVIIRPPGPVPALITRIKKSDAPAATSSVAPAMTSPAAPSPTVRVPRKRKLPPDGAPPPTEKQKTAGKRQATTTTSSAVPEKKSKSAFTVAGGPSTSAASSEQVTSPARPKKSTTSSVESTDRKLEVTLTDEEPSSEEVVSTPVKTVAAALKKKKKKLKWYQKSSRSRILTSDELELLWFFRSTTRQRGNAASPDYILALLSIASVEEMEMVLSWFRYKKIEVSKPGQPRLVCGAIRYKFNARIGRNLRAVPWNVDYYPRTFCMACKMICSRNVPIDRALQRLFSHELV